MAIRKVQGMALAIGTAFGSTITVSALTNASEGVATFSASHGVVVNDIVQMFSGWKRLNERVVRAKTVATNDVTLEGINTTSTTDYPAGEGIGTAREVSTWTSITQLMPEVSVSGGGFRNTEVTEMDDVRVRNLPILAEGVELSFKGHLDSTLSWIDTITNVARAGTAYPYRITLPDGGKYYGSAFVGFNPEPQIENGILVYSLTLNLSADSKFYTS